MDHLVDDWIAFDRAIKLADQGVQTQILVVGIYDDLDWQKVRQLVLCSYSSSGFRLGFMTGRDLHSLLWMASKQWGTLKSDVQEIGFFSGVDSPTAQYPVRVFSEAEFDKEDIRSILLDQTWRGGVFIPFFSTRPILRKQYTKWFSRIEIERRPYQAYDETTYTYGNSGDAYIQCFINK